MIQRGPGGNVLKLRKIDASIDRQIVTGMVVSDRYLKAVQSIYKPEFLMAKFAITVAGWCIDYWRRYEKAPGPHIQDIFYAKQREGLDDTSADSIMQFLESISSEYERSDKFNVEYLLDSTKKLFRTRDLKYRIEDADAHLERGELEDAEDIFTDFSKVDLPQATGIDPFKDEEVWKRAFESRKEPLFKVPGALGQLLNPHFIRSGLVGFLGRAKIGKTWRMWDFASWALKDRCNVTFFQAGDLTEDDKIIRMGVYMAKKSNDPRYCGDINVPVLDCLNNQLATCKNKTHGTVVIDETSHEPSSLDEDIVYHRPCHKCARKDPQTFRGSVWYEKRPKVEPLEWKEAYEAAQRWAKRFRIRGFRLATYPNSTLTVKEIERQLDLWESEDGFVTDVIIVDYPDIMAAEDPRELDGRQKENTRWKALRRLSQERHALVLVPTQSNRAGFDRDILKITDLGEDQRKTHHVTAFFGLNQTEAEERRGIIRISSLGQAREGDLRTQVCVLQSLAQGRPYVASFVQSKATHTNDSKKSNGYQK